MTIRDPFSKILEYRVSDSFLRSNPPLAYVKNVRARDGKDKQTLSKAYHHVSCRRMSMPTVVKREGEVSRGIDLG